MFFGKKNLIFDFWKVNNLVARKSTTDQIFYDIENIILKNRKDFFLEKKKILSTEWL